MTCEARDPAAAPADRGDLLDLATVLAVTEAIAGEIDLDKLVATLLTLCIEPGGAARSCLFLQDDAGLQAVAHAAASQDGITLGPLDAVVDGPTWPTSLLHLVALRRESVLLDDPGLADDAYFGRHAPRSVLCLPLVERTRLAGVLYLEHATRGTFTRQRTALLRLIATQAAIALGNAGRTRALERENRERQQAEEAMQQATRALADSEERFYAMANATPDVLWISEANPERLLYVNPSFERIWGITAAQLFDDVKLWVEGIHPEDRDRVRAHFDAWAGSEGLASWEIEFRVLKPDGSIRWMHDRGVFLRGEPGRPRRIGGISMDVTERREAVLALQRSEERHAMAMEAARDGHWDWVAATDTYYASPRMLEIYGFPPDTRFDGRQDFLDRFPFYPGEREKWKRRIDAFFAGDETRIEIDLRLLRGGELRWVNTHGLVIRDAQGRPIRYTGSVSDITERKAAEDALRESEQRFALATEGSSDGIYDWDLTTNLMFLSHRCQQLYGLEPGTPVRPRSEWVARVTIHPEEADRQRQLIGDYLAGRIPSYDNEWRVLHPDGSYRWIRLRGVCKRDVEGRAIRIAGSVSDIDARRRAEAGMQQMQRLEAVGTLAGGVAHDFNNILAVILGFSEAAMKHTRAGSRLRRDLERILSAGERGRALVDRILAFSRSSVGARIVVDVGNVVAESLTMLAAMCPPQVTLDVALESGDATIVGDPTQVHQLVMNLATNGMQAMPSGGALHIHLGSATIGEARMSTIGPLPCGEYVTLAVRDEGCGIDPAIREKIFDPFFTTKEVGTGTGLGLSLVHGIVAELGGAIDVVTQQGDGSCFTIHLPRGAEAAGFQVEAAPALARGRRERILLVDDEEALVHLSSSMLADLGYQPAGYTSARDALEAFTREPDAFDAVITDSRMPHMSGLGLIRALRERGAGVPILLISGFLGGEATVEARAAGADAILNKPLSRRDLAQALSGALAGAPRVAAAPRCSP